jgi:hypothetical protein
VNQDHAAAERTCRVIVVCPNPHHEFTVRQEPTNGNDPAAQACEHVFALLNIGRAGVDDLAELGYPPEQVEAVRAWYTHHTDLRPGTTLEVVTAEGSMRRLVCDDIRRAHADDNPGGY